MDNSVHFFEYVIRLTAQEFESLIENSQMPSVKKYFEKRHEMHAQNLKDNAEFIEMGHHFRCECGCLEMSIEQRIQNVWDNGFDESEAMDLIEEQEYGNLEMLNELVLYRGEDVEHVSRVISDMLN